MKYPITVRLDHVDRNQLARYREFRAKETGLPDFSLQQAALELLRLGLEEQP